MSTTTANLGLTLPTPNVDTGWGSTLNTDFTLIDNLFASGGTGTSVGVNVGSGKTLVLGGTMILGSGDGTASPVAATIKGPAKTGTDVAGVNITIDAGNGTGTGGSGDIIFRTAPPNASSGSTANTFGSSVTIRNSGDQYVLDVGDGGSGATNNISSVRVNGSSSGTALEGGAAYYIANNSTETGAFGNRSTIMAGTTAFSNLTTIWGASSISFFTGARSTGALAASQEKLRLGSSGQLYVWDTTLGTPALNAGTAGQYLKSNGSSAGLTWDDVLGRGVADTFGTTGIEFTNIPSTAKEIIISFYNLNPTNNIRVQVGTASSWLSTSYISYSSMNYYGPVVPVRSTTGFIINSYGFTCVGNVRLLNMSSNVWVVDHTLGASDGGTQYASITGGGYIGAGAEVTRVRVIPDTGSFAASGTCNIFYV